MHQARTRQPSSLKTPPKPLSSTATKTTRPSTNQLKSASRQSGAPSPSHKRVISDFANTFDERTFKQ